MMKKRTILITASSIFVVLLFSLFVIYWLYFAKPTALPDDEELKKQMNDIFPKAKVEIVQDTIQLDAAHVFVPFQSKSGTYGIGYWIWEKHRWKPAIIDTKGEPMIWKTDSEDSSTTHIVWNLHPDDDISEADFYMKRKRNYLISGETNNYYPPIQMKDNVKMNDQSYGVWNLPDDWDSFMSQANQFATKRRQNNVHGNFLLEDVYFGYIPYNDAHDITYAEHSMNGSSYTHSHIDVNFVQRLEEGDIDK